MNTEAQPNKCKVCFITLIVCFLVFLGSIGFFLRVLDKVISGHGLDYYTTFWGIQFNYIGALTVLIVGFALAVLSPLIYWVGTAEERSFKRKYGIHE